MSQKLVGALRHPEITTPIVGLDRTIKNNEVCTSYKYRWDEFYTSNHLNVDDTCFFSVIRKGTYNVDEEWEEKQEEDEAKFKVEVHKKNGR